MIQHVFNQHFLLFFCSTADNCGMYDCRGQGMKQKKERLYQQHRPQKKLRKLNSSIRFQPLVEGKRVEITVLSLISHGVRSCIHQVISFAAKAFYWDLARSNDLIRNPCSH